MCVPSGMTTLKRKKKKGKKKKKNLKEGELDVRAFRDDYALNAATLAYTCVYIVPYV